MDSILYDELLQEIFHRLPYHSSSAVSLVSKRWLHLLRSSHTSLSLHLNPHHHSPDIINPSLSSFLSHYPYLSSLSLTTAVYTTNLADHLLLSVADSCPILRSLRLSTGPVSLSSLLSLSTSCPLLCFLTIPLSTPISLHFLSSFPSLSHLSLVFSGFKSHPQELNFDSEELNSHSEATELRLESLCLSGVRLGDESPNWLWKNLKSLKKLRLRSCEGVGDEDIFASFLDCVKGLLQEVELRTSRPIVDGILTKLAEYSASLTSLLVYDGGSKQGLLHFITQSRCNLQKLDLRLPLDLTDDHLSAVAAKFKGLTSLQLESCCLVTGEGLKILNDGLEELALINCDAIERENGLLTSLGQNLRGLRKLDLSYNENLSNKEFKSMMISSGGLRELRLRGCSWLTRASLLAVIKNCKHLESVDITYCGGLEAGAVELFVLNSPRLRRVQVEESKLSAVARTWAGIKLIEVLSDL